MKQGPPRILVWIALLAGLTSSGIGVFEVQREMELSAKGIRSSARVVDFVHPKWSYGGVSADLDVVSPDAQILRIHIEHASSLRDWAKGITLNVVCARNLYQLEDCRINAFADRWLEPTLLLLVGLPALGWSGVALLDGWRWS